MGIPLDRKAIIDKYWKHKDADPNYSLRQYSGDCNTPYYTMRDWYRDPRYNVRFNKRLMYTAGKGMTRASEDDGFPFQEIAL